MLGFVVTTSDAGAIDVEGTHYHVTQEGNLVVYVDDDEVGRWGPSEWNLVGDLGIRLSQTWPTAMLDDVLDQLKWTLGATFGDYVHLVGPKEKYCRGFFNELDALTAAILSSVGLSVGLGKSTHAQVPAVREHLANAFDVEVPDSAIRPSQYATDKHCPRCGDTLYLKPGSTRTLECHLGQMELGQKATATLTTLHETSPTAVPNRHSDASWHGRWHCFSDGARMHSSPTELPECPWCHRVLPNDLINALIHVHHR